MRGRRGGKPAPTISAKALPRTRESAARQPQGSKKDSGHSLVHRADAREAAASLGLRRGFLAAPTAARAALFVIESTAARLGDGRLLALALLFAVDAQGGHRAREQ